MSRTLRIASSLAFIFFGLIAAPLVHANVPIPLDSRGMPTLAPMLAQVTPAVVNIAVLVREPEENPLFRDPFFRRFFEMPDRQQQPQVSAGSGVIVDAVHGIVLTNHHVIKDAQEIVVTLKDRRMLPAQLVGSDPGTDVAVLRIKPENLTAIPFGDSDAMEVGDFVAAIGNPFGIGQTVTSGIVSAVGRSGLTPEGYEDFIQTDASINPGNSGGALVNMKGELIGLNSAIIGPSGGNVGIGFAVPSSMVRPVLDQILRYGEVKRGRFGVTAQDLTPDLAQALGVGVNEGAVLVAVEKGSPADKAGLKVRDVITHANGKIVHSSGDLRNRVGLTPVGEEVELRVLRNGQAQTVRVRIGEPLSANNISGEMVPQLAGARVATLGPGMPRYGEIEGVIVTAVDRASAAYRNGIRAGDIIYGVGRKRVRNLKEFAAALRTAEKTLRISLLRGDFRVMLVVR